MEYRSKGARAREEKENGILGKEKKALFGVLIIYDMKREREREMGNGRVVVEH